MFEQLFIVLKQSGWVVSVLEENWVRATKEDLNRGLLLGNLSELPQQFQPWTESAVHVSQWDAVVFCPEGIDSDQLKQQDFPGIQVWYWDTRLGNLFPFPPTNDPWVPNFLRQLASGQPVPSEESIKSAPEFKPFLSYTFIGLCSVYFLLMIFTSLKLTPNGNLFEFNNYITTLFGAKVNRLILEGEVWRLLTCMFIHGGFLHFVINMYAIRALGPFAEKSFGHLRFFILYILSGLGGSVASFIFSPYSSVGASGAIFGLLGAILWYCYKRPALWKSGLGVNLLVVVLINFSLGLIVQGIDNFAHLGGFLTGAVCSMIFLRKVKR